jgi:hypothetical protein
MTTNAEARLVEARDNVWLGEVAALEESLTHLRRCRAEAKSQTRSPSRGVQLSAGKLRTVEPGTVPVAAQNDLGQVWNRGPVRVVYPPQ